MMITLLGKGSTYITNRSIIVWTFPPPLMGEGGVDKTKTLSVPSPSPPGAVKKLVSFALRPEGQSASEVLECALLDCE